MGDNMDKIVLLIIFFIMLIVLFLILYKPFGGVPNKDDFKKYLKRSSIIRNEKFINTAIDRKYVDLYSNRTTNKGVKPRDKFLVKRFSYVSSYDKDDVLITWFGHSTILIQMSGLNILIDPMFSFVSSPIFIGPKRFSDLPCCIGNLPDIDVVIVTHDHYDHLDYDSIKELDKKTSRFIVPLGIEKDLEKFGVDRSKIINMAWWEEVHILGLTIGCTPSRHYSGRFKLDDGKSLYSSFIFSDSYNTIFYSGDTGYGDHFNEIGKKYDIDFSMLDSGQYNVKSHGYHMFPEEAVRASIDLKSNLSMPVHWGAFVLSNHSFDDPVNRFVMKAKEDCVNYMMPKIGQTVSIKDYKSYQDEWWKNIK